MNNKKQDLHEAEGGASAEQFVFEFLSAMNKSLERGATPFIPQKEKAAAKQRDPIKTGALKRT
jgi:hypothetical protein